MPRDSRPNILLLLTDQQRADTIHALGNPVIRTPALDGLVREGVTFTRAFTPSPVCVAARCALSTGLPPHVTGCTDNTAAPPEATSFMQRLADAGYQTHGAGKMHFAPNRRAWGFESRDVSEELGEDDDYRRFLEQEGFGHVDEPHGVRSEMYYVPQPSQLPARLHHSTWTADRSIAFLERRDTSRPFLLWSSFIKPHPPFESPTPWNKLYRTAEMPPPFRPENFEGLLTHWNHVQNRYKYRDDGRDGLLERTIRAAYLACVSFVDFNVGRILRALGPDARDTLVVFTSDHGELLGDYGSWGKRSMLDASVRVPLVVRWPGHLDGARRVGVPVTLLDLFPTFLDAARLDAPPSPSGTSLRVLAGRTEDQDRLVLSQFQSGPLGLYMAASRRWKYVWSAPDGREWLFDARTDPRESRDLAPNPFHAEVLRTLRNALLDRLRREGAHDALDTDGWRRFPPPVRPTGPDGGLLFQDRVGTQAHLDALGAYARRATPSAEHARQELPDLGLES